MTLKPDPAIHRLMISSTSHFVGEYDDGEISIHHAWPSASRNSMASVSRRTALVVSFVVPEPEKQPGIVIPNYHEMGDHLGAYMCILFGKRFDNMGVVHSHGLFGVPDLGVYGVPHRLGIPHNSDKPRADIALPLNVAEMRRLRNLLHAGAEDTAALTRFNAACAFYYQSLRNFETDPEVSYLHLITAGEILAGATEVPDDELLDDQLKAALARITCELSDGEAMSRMLRRRLFQVKRRFRIALGGLLDAEFFENSESQVAYGRLTQDTISKRLAAAYDLRSRYVHVGENFGHWVSQSLENSEIQIGSPVLSDKELVKLLVDAPNFIGLERIIRYCLLRFAEQKFGIDLKI